MSIIKKVNSDGSSVTVLFSVSKEAAENAKTLHLAGSFNNWDFSSEPMKRKKDGTFETRVELEPGNKYQFRYVKDNEFWLNEWEADSYVPTNVCDNDNSVIIL